MCPILHCNLDHILKTLLIDYLTSNYLHDPNQSTCTKHHLTEPIISLLHTPLPNATSHQQVSCICLHDLCGLWYRWSFRYRSWSVLPGSAYLIFLIWPPVLSPLSIDAHSQSMTPLLRCPQGCVSAPYFSICAPPNSALSLPDHHFRIIYTPAIFNCSSPPSPRTLPSPLPTLRPLSHPSHLGWLPIS